MQHSRNLLITVVSLSVFLSALEAAASPAPMAGIVEVTPVPAVAHPAREALLALLEQYEQMQADGGWPHIPDGPTIRPAEPPAPPSSQVSSQVSAQAQPGEVVATIIRQPSDPRVPVLRQLLKLTGDYPIDDAASKHSEVYDVDLQEAVRLFQQRHGLEQDALVGSQTLAALNTPLSFRIRQIKATLARIAHAPAASERYIVVNIPEFRLRAYDAGDEVLTSKVIVGTSKRPTPVFDSQLVYVSFNPPWGVPVSIAADEMLPKIIEYPDFLKDHHYRVFEILPEGRFEVDPTTIAWETLSKKHFPYLIMQDPGDDNALGKIKFGLKNSDGIYLHDTSSRKFFDKDMRALSHGCVRVEKPRELAHFVFSPMKKIPQDKVDALYDSAQEKILRVNSIPVHFVYWTAWVDPQSGRPQFRKDIYGKDAAYKEPAPSALEAKN